MRSDIINKDIELLASLPLWDCLNTKSLLITGATGALGTYLTLAALRAREVRGCHIRLYALCRDEKKAKSMFKETDTIFLFQDTRTPLPSEIQFDYILHTASPVGPGIFAAVPEEVLSVNVTGTLNLLSHAAKHNCAGFAFASTHEVYGDVPGKQTVSETDMGIIDPMSSRACYAQGKRAAETALACYHEKYGLRAMSARLARFYGPGMNLDSGLFICDFIKDALAGRAVAVQGPGNLLRPLSYIADVASAMLYVLLRGEGGKAYNVQGRGSLTIADIARQIAERKGVDVTFKQTNALKESPVGQQLETNRIRALGFDMDMPFSQGLCRTLDYFEAQGGCDL